MAVIAALAGSVAVAVAAPRAVTAAASNRTVLTVHGSALHWTRVPGVSRYVVAITAGTQPTRYRVVRGMTFTPVRRSHETVHYRVRAESAGSPWTRPLSITYGAPRTAPTALQFGVNGGTTAGAASAGGGSAGASSTGQPSSTTGQQSSGPPSSGSGSSGTGSSGPPSSGPPATSALKVGVMDLGNYNYAPFDSASLFSQTGITYTREDVDRGQDTGTCNATDYVCTALRNGIAPLVLFEGYADSNMTSEIVNLAQKLNALATTYPIMNNMHVIEFGNEVWWGTSGPAENAITYGEQYNAAHAALTAAGLGSWKLLADGDGLGTCVNSYTSPAWINQVIAAQSGGAAGVDGWTVHPYGPMTTDYGCGAAGQGYGWPEVVDYHNIAVAAGSDAPWYVTEVGQCLGGAGCNDPVPMGSASDTPQSAGAAPYFTQAADMRQYLTDAGGDVRTDTAAKYPWIAALIFYQAYDDGSGWFGLLSNGSNLGQPADFERPAFTELKQWIASNGEG